MSNEQSKKQVVILVDGVTCGKAENMVFSFTYRKKLVQSAVLPLLQANEFYGYQHHVDASNFSKFQQVVPNLQTYEQACKEFQAECPGVVPTVEGWLEECKFNFAYAIANGLWDRASEEVEVKFQWKGEEPLHPPVAKTRELPKPKAEKPSEAELAGLSLV